jgi:hypothetical protein
VQSPLVITSLINGQVCQPSQEADVRVLPFDFEATEITVEAASEKGRGFFASMFGAGAVSVNMKKSAAFDFERFAESKGMVLA